MRARLRTSSIVPVYPPDQFSPFRLSGPDRKLIQYTHETQLRSQSIRMRFAQ
jgi:hypothetical protein